MLKLTVVLPTYNRLEQLKIVLAGLENQDYPRDEYEVVVVSDGSSDGTDEYVSKLETQLRLSLVSQENGGVAVARNTGFAHAQGKLVLFIDDDVVPSSHLIREHMQIHDNSEDVIAVIGPMLTPVDFDMKPWVAWEQAMLYKQYHAMQIGEFQPTARQFYTGNTSLPLECLIKSGGFDTSFRRAEDVELAYRLDDQGVKFIFAPNAIGYHYADRSFESWLMTPYAYGRNDVIFCLEKGQSWLLDTIFSEFIRTRNVLIKLLIWIVLDRDRLSSISVGLLKQFANLGSKWHISQIPRLAFSAIFNLRYYQGVSDELGGRNIFLAGLKSR